MGLTWELCLVFMALYAALLSQGWCVGDCWALEHKPGISPPPLARPPNPPQPVEMLLLPMIVCSSTCQNTMLPPSPQDIDILLMEKEVCIY